MTTILLYFLLALSVSFLCSLMESVLLSLTRSHIAVLIKEKHTSGRLLEKLKGNMNRPLAAILSLNTIANTVGAAGVGAVTFNLYGSKWVAVTSGILTLSILIFSEIIPKTIGVHYWKNLASTSAYLIRWMMVLMYPFVIILEALSNWLKPDIKQDTVTKEDVIAMAEIGEDEGTIDEDETTIIENILRLDNVTAEEVLTPRTVVFALKKNMTVRQALDENPNIVFSRIPIYSESLENIVGLVQRYELFKSKAEDLFDITMEELSNPVHVVQEKDSVGEILDEFVRRREHLFIVRDEFGQFAGIITLEDAIETLLGVEIVDEIDTVVDMRKLAVSKSKERK
ncbi:MAG: HlyC/CorC family transporter [Candidatus Marinimicrobia bacterium]|nr:HlyC/CorC family transporter [Candidatus Neomarinimicrobiota bacterium]